MSELGQLRAAATDPKTKRYLRERENQARDVLDWLIRMRQDVHR